MSDSASTIQRARGRPRRFDRVHATENAMMLLWQRGPASMSVNQLCREMGLSKPTLYREFAGDDGLLAAALAHYQVFRIDPLLAQLQRDRPMQTAIDNLALWFGAPSDLPAGCLLAKSRAVKQRLGPAARRQMDSMREAQLAALTTWMTAASAKGELAEGVSVALAARYIDTQFTALLTLLAEGESRELVAAQARLAMGGITRPA